MSKHAKHRRNLRRQGNLLASEAMSVATDLREALRPVVAFRGTLEKATTEDELRLAVLESNLPAAITKALDIHQNLLLALALSAKGQAPTEVEEKVQKDLVQDAQPEPEEQPKRRFSFLD